MRNNPLKYVDLDGREAKKPDYIGLAIECINLNPLKGELVASLDNNLVNYKFDINDINIDIEDIHDNEIDNTIKKLKKILFLLDHFSYLFENINPSFIATIKGYIDKLEDKVTGNGLDNALYNNNEYYKYHADMISQITSIDTNKFSWDINNFKSVYEKNKEIYESISKKTGIPPELIVALHYRESGANFNTYLHNGQPLGQPTTIIPKNVLYYDFEEAAVHALTTSYNGGIRDEFNLTANSEDKVAMMAFAEKYNGLGYYNNNRVSPYIYSGTDVYTSGKYTTDGNYNSAVVDKQPGVYLLVSQLIN